jgi:hypothetical protein
VADDTAPEQGQAQRRPVDLAAVVRCWLEPTTRAVPVYKVVGGELVSTTEDRQVGAVLDELRSEVSPSQTAAGGGGSGRSPAATLEAIDALDLVYGTVRDWCAMVGLKVRRDADPIADGMRQLVAHGWTGHEAKRDQLARILDRQRRSTERLLAGDANRYVSGTRCPECKAERVREDDETVHAPLRIDRERSETPDGRPGPILGTRCTNPACNRWWPYAQMGEGGQLDLELAADRAAHQADLAALSARRAARRAEEAHRAAVYDDVTDSARRLGLPVI